MIRTTNSKFVVILLGLFASLCGCGRATTETGSVQHRQEEEPSNFSLRGQQKRRKTTQVVESRIVGGNVAKLNSRPYYVQWEHGCSGVLFHDDLVLTAAHCNTDSDAIKRSPVYVGGDGTHASGTPMFAVEAHQHPRYNSQKSHQYDFVVLKLPQKVDGVDFVKLNSNPQLPRDNTPLTVVGHGVLQEDDRRDDRPTRLHQVTIPYIDDCRPYFPQVNPHVQFCAGEMPQGGKDACQGDSGSGIFLDDDNKHNNDGDLLVGLVSWGIGCARRNRPGVYARISTIERWLAHMKCQVSEYAPQDECTTLTVRMTVDDYPEEIGLSLLDATTSNNSPQQQQSGDSESPEESEVVVLPAGTLTAAARQTLHYTFRVPKGRDYVLRVYDSNKDGFCCSYGEGSLTVTDGNILYTLNTPNFTTESTSLLIPQVGTTTTRGGASSQGEADGNP